MRLKTGAPTHQACREVPDDSEEVQHAIGELSRLLLTEEDLDVAMRRVADLAVAFIPVCDCCGVSLSNQGTITTRVATSDVAQRVDDKQYQADDGPCLYAVRSGEAVRVDAIESDQRWPAFAAAAVTEGIQSSYSVPFLVDHTVVGALNLYSRSQPFSDDNDRVALELAAQAAVTLANAVAYNRMQSLVGNLQEALTSRDIIGQAKGIIMERQRCTADEAFDFLRRISQTRNVKLRDLARQVAETGTWEEIA